MVIIMLYDTELILVNKKPKIVKTAPLIAHRDIFPSGQLFKTQGYNISDDIKQLCI